MHFILYLPNHDAWTPVNCRNSYGLFSLFNPVRAGITIVGNAIDKPKSKSRKFFAVAANTYKHLKMILILTLFDIKLLSVSHLR